MDIHNYPWISIVRILDIHKYQMKSLLALHTRRGRKSEFNYPGQLRLLKDIDSACLYVVPVYCMAYIVLADDHDRPLPRAKRSHYNPGRIDEDVNPDPSIQ